MIITWSYRREMYEPVIKKILWHSSGLAWVSLCLCFKTSTYKTFLAKLGLNWVEMNLQMEHIVLFQKISILPTEGFFSLTLPHPSRNSSLASCFPLKKCAFETPSASALEFPLWWIYRFFLELHISIPVASHEASFLHRDVRQLWSSLSMWCNHCHR